MKEYIKPIIIEENIELEDIIAVSGVTNVKAPTGSYDPSNDAPDKGNL